MKRILSITLSFILILSVISGIGLYAPQAVDYRSIVGTYEYNYLNRVLSLVNAQRNAAGLGSLYMTESLNESAMLRAAETVELFDHQRPNGSMCFTAIKWRKKVGENIAYGQITPEEVVEDWMNSPGHRANIMDGAFTMVGLGCFEYDGVLYWTQAFSGGIGVPAAPTGERTAQVDISKASGKETLVDGKDINTIVNEIVAKEKITNPGVYAQMAAEASPTETAVAGTSTQETTPSPQTVNLVINIRKSLISKLKPGKKQLAITWKKADDVDGYEVQYSTNKNFKKDAKTFTANKKTTSKTVKKLKAKKKYFVRVRTYRVVQGQKYYSSWSGAKNVTVKG